MAPIRRFHELLWSPAGPQSTKLRPSPSPSINQVLRRRTACFHPTRTSTRYVTSTSKHSEPSLSASSFSGDDVFVPFDNFSPQSKNGRQVEAMSQGAVDYSLLPLSRSHLYSPGTASSSHERPGDASQEYEPVIELTLRTEESDNVAVGQRFAEDPSQRLQTAQNTAEMKRISRQARLTSTATPRRRRDRSAYMDRRAQSTSAPVRVNAKRESWQIQKRALRDKFGDQAWNPRKKVSPDAIEGIRALHVQYPEQFTTPVLADHFKVSPEAIRRILKSKWRPNADEEEERRLRWDKRGEKIWSNLVETGVHPPKRWRTMGIGTGPRRPAQDRSLRDTRSGNIEGERSSTKEEGNDGSAWMRSLAGRIA